jgi:hypothetical protein
MSQHPERIGVRTLVMPSPVTRATDRTAVRLLLGAAAAGAGVIHLAFAPEHLREYLPLGLGFLVAGVLQIAWGAAIATRESRRLLLLGGAFSLVFVAVYVMSRTTGLPLGPDAFEPEGVGAADLLCCALEVPVGLAALVLAGRPRLLVRGLRLRLVAAVGVAFVLVGSATAYAASAPAHEHTHEHVHEQMAPMPEHADAGHHG